MPTRLCATAGCLALTADASGLCSHCRQGATPRSCATPGCTHTARIGHQLCASCRRVLRQRADDLERQHKHRNMLASVARSIARHQAIVDAADEVRTRRARAVAQGSAASVWQAMYRSC